jgi:hypothetical protein
MPTFDFACDEDVCTFMCVVAHVASGTVVYSDACSPGQAFPLTAGDGSFTMDFSLYAEVPADVLDSMAAQSAT